jgi:hypothetical protein
MELATPVESEPLVERATGVPAAPSMLNVTVPPGIWAAQNTVAVKVTAWLRVDGFIDDASDTNTLLSTSTCVNTSDVEGSQLPSPE